MAEIQPRKIEAHEITSEFLGETRTVKVFVPPNFDANKQYPVMYCHDGLEFFTHGRVATLANQLIIEGKLSPLLIVGIQVSKTHRTADYAVNGANHRSYCQFVIEEVLPKIEAIYPVDQAKRWMAGISLGASVTMSLAISRPDLFADVLMFSGAYYPAVQQLVKAEGDLSWLRAHLIVGRQETAVDTPDGAKDFYLMNQQMRDMLEIRRARIVYREADGTHIWGFWQQELPEALLTIQQLFET